jgi:hypothetical protein
MITIDFLLTRTKVSSFSLHGYRREEEGLTKMNNKLATTTGVLSYPQSLSNALSTGRKAGLFLLQLRPQEGHFHHASVSSPEIGSCHPMRVLLLFCSTNPQG